MKYYDLNDGEYKKGRLTKDQMWEAFRWLFSEKSLNDSSYKFIFLKSIIDCMERKEANGRISFDTLFDRFTSISWSLVLKYRINQKVKARGKKATLLEQDLLDFFVSGGYEKYVPISEISEKSRKKLVKKVKQDCKRYVVGALYGDMKELLYSFSRKEEWIELNQQMESFIEKHKELIESLNYYKWAVFYQKINAETTARNCISLLAPGFEKRKSESIYRTILAYEFEREVPETMNSIELLFCAEDMSQDMEVSKDNLEEELFQDYGSMRDYLSNPIVLIEKLKRQKGIIV